MDRGNDMRIGLKDNREVIFTGAATIDAYPLFDVPDEDICEWEITLRDGEDELKIEIDDGPLRVGEKCYGKGRFSIDLEQFKTVRTFGGGAYNSYMAYRKLQDELHGKRPPEMLKKLFYLDMSAPYRSFAGERVLLSNELDKEGTGYHFCDKRAMPVNLVLSDIRARKRIAKSYPDPGWNVDETRLQEHEKNMIREIAQNCYALFQNSPKDREIVETLLEGVEGTGARIYNVITKSFDWEFVRDRLMGNGTILANYDELGWLMEGPEFEGDENERIVYALDWLKQIKRDNLNGGYDMHVTAGKNGVLFKHEDTIYHIHVTDEKNEQVQAAIENRLARGLALYKTGKIDKNGLIDYIRGTCGAGDTYSGALAFYELEMGERNPVDAAKYASIAAMRYIGYDGDIDFYRDFVVRTIPISKIYVSLTPTESTAELLGV